MVMQIKLIVVVVVGSSITPKSFADVTGDKVLPKKVRVGVVDCLLMSCLTHAYLTLLATEGAGYLYFSDLACITCNYSLHLPV